MMVWIMLWRVCFVQSWQESEMPCTCSRIHSTVTDSSEFHFFDHLTYASSHLLMLDIAWSWWSATCLCYELITTMYALIKVEWLMFKHQACYTHQVKGACEMQVSRDWWVINHYYSKHNKQKERLKQLTFKHVEIQNTSPKSQCTNGAVRVVSKHKLHDYTSLVLPSIIHLGLWNSTCAALIKQYLVTGRSSWSHRWGLSQTFDSVQMWQHTFILIDMADLAAMKA